MIKSTPSWLLCWPVAADETCFRYEKLYAQHIFRLYFFGAHHKNVAQIDGPTATDNTEKLPSAWLNNNDTRDEMKNIMINSEEVLHRQFFHSIVLFAVLSVLGGQNFATSAMRLRIS